MDPIWFKDINVLFNDQRYLEFFPSKYMSPTEKMNAAVRLSIYISVALSVITQKYTYVYIALFTMGLTYFLYTNEITKEHFQLALALCEQQNQSCTRPTVNNPLMNINLITDPKDKDAACPPTPEIKEEIEEKFNVNLYRDVGDLYGKSNSQREYYTMPSTTIPNKQTEYAKWLYGQSSTCKEDGVKCAPNWDPE